MEPQKGTTTPAGRKPRSKRPAGQGAAWPSLPGFLNKFCELSLLAALFGAVFAYHFKIPDGALKRVWDFMMELNGGKLPTIDGHPGALLIRDLIPFIDQGMPVLETKVTVWLLLATLLIGGHVVARLYEAFFRTPVFASGMAREKKGANWTRLVPFLALTGFLIWSLASFSPFGWGPKPPVDAIPFSNGEEGVAAGGSYHSWVAWIQVATALVFFLSAEDIIRTRRLVYKILCLFMGLGFAVSATAILVHANAPLLTDVWVRWGAENYRNDVAGFLGHNTALSSFLMAPFLITLTMLIAHRQSFPKWVIAGLCVSLAVMALSILMAQSRAVIPILIVTTIVLLVFLARRATLRLPMAFYVAVPLVLFVLVLSQFVAHPYNPLYRRNLPLANRIQHMTAEHLQTETRLRILVCSLPVIAGKPLQGTGFGTFHYVYPEAQGEFFQNHPDTFIVPTPKKTFRAHNEYLQTLFETGLIGLLLGLAGVGAILVSAWRSLGCTFRQRHIALELAILGSTAALLVHGFLDFPLRVAPLACSLIILLAICSAGDRLWILPVKNLEERPSDRDGSDTREAIPANPALSRPAPVEFGLGVAWLVIALLAPLAFVGAATMSSNWLSARIINLRSQSAIDYYLQAKSQGTRPNPRPLHEARGALKDARRMQPLFGETYYYGARIAHIMASEMYSFRREALLGERPPEQAEAIRRELLLMNRESLQLLNQSLNEFRFHGSYHQRALIQFLFYQNTPEPERLDHLSRALEDLEFAVLMNPGDAGMIRTLITWKEHYEDPSHEEIKRLYETLYRFNKPYFMEEMLREAQIYQAAMYYDEAEKRRALFYEIDPNNVTITEHLATHYTLTGQIGKARELVSVLESLESPFAPAVQAQAAIVEGRFEGALSALDHPLMRQPGMPRDYRFVLRHLILAEMASRQGDMEKAEEHYQSIIEYARKNPELMTDAAMALNSFFDNPAQAVRFARERIQIKDPPPRESAFVQMAHGLVEPYSDRLDELEETGETIQDPEMRDAVVQALKTLQSGLEESLKHPDRRLLHQLLRKRIERLEGLLGQGGEG